jgi:hypothetical protein
MIKKAASGKAGGQFTMIVLDAGDVLDDASCQGSRYRRGK